MVETRARAEGATRVLRVEIRVGTAAGIEVDLLETAVKRHFRVAMLTAHALTPEALDRLLQCRWEGNARELENCIERGVALGAPKPMEWYSALGVVSTLVWLYMEMLRFLAALAARNQGR